MCKSIYYSVRVVKNALGISKRVAKKTILLPPDFSIEDQPQKVRKHIKACIEKGYVFQRQWC